jgi:hypothetical protein
MSDSREPNIELLTGHEAFAARALELAEGAVRELALLTQNLDRRIYGTEAFATAIRQFVRQNEHTRFRIIAVHPRLAIAGNPRLVEFGRAMSSRIEFREPPTERRTLIREEYLIADGRRLLYHETPEDLESRYYGESPDAARLQLGKFDALWNESVTAQELRNLRL